MKKMQKKDIPAFVREVLAAGFDICAIGYNAYSVADSKLPRGKRSAGERKLREIVTRYGERDHLRTEIASYLRSIGRHVSLPGPPPLNPPRDTDVADTAPHSPILIGYDQQHFVTYMRLLDAEADGADWREVAQIVLHIDPERAPERARRAWQSHLARAQWMTKEGYKQLLRGGVPH